MDSIEIRGLSCRCIIGIWARERRVMQPVKLDIDLDIDLERAGRSGRIAHTVDYARASREIVALLKFRCYSLLEVAAEECAGWLFAAYPSVQAVRLAIAKPEALAGQAESGGVRIHRNRPTKSTRGVRDFGFVEAQLQTSEAAILLVGIDPSKSLTPRSLGGKSALVLPLGGRLRTNRLLRSHEPVLLGEGEECVNDDGVGALLVVCALTPAPH